MDRKELIEKFINKFGKERIGYITADREFDGYEWLSYLQAEEIDYVQRLKENTINMTNSRGKFTRASVLCSGVEPGSEMGFGKRKIYQSCSLETEITVAKSPLNVTVLLAHSRNIKDPTLAYRQRWSIESGFKAMKSGGFNMDHTHLIKPKRICNLFKIIAILTCLTLKIGVLIDQKYQKNMVEELGHLLGMLYRS